MHRTVLGTISGSRLSLAWRWAVAALVLGAGVAAAPVGDAAAAQSLAVPAIGQAGLSSMIGARRGAMTAANAPSPSETLYLRRRADYASEAQMIDGEIALLREETQALQSFNKSAALEVEASEREAARVEQETLAAKRRQVAALQETLETDRKRLRKRLKAAEDELRTTRHLREQSKDGALDAQRDDWERRERELEEERDRLRGLLERVSQLAAVFN